MTAGSEVRRP